MNVFVNNVLVTNEDGSPFMLPLTGQTTISEIKNWSRQSFPDISSLNLTFSDGQMLHEVVFNTNTYDGINLTAYSDIINGGRINITTNITTNTRPTLPIETLPIDVTRLIMEYTDDEELAKNCMLNKFFSVKVCDDNFWMRKIFERFGLNREEVNLYRKGNSIIAYYNYLSNVEKLGLSTPVAELERIYNHPDFQDAKVEVDIVTRDAPTNIDINAYKSTLLYRVIDKFWNNAVLETVEFYDFDKYPWIYENFYDIPVSIRTYINSRNGSYLGMDDVYDQIYTLAEGLSRLESTQSLVYPGGRTLNRNALKSLLRQWVKTAKHDKTTISKMKNNILNLLRV